MTAFIEKASAILETYLTYVRIANHYKSTPILHSVPSPKEINLKSLCYHEENVDVKEESASSPAAGFILDLWSRDDHVGYIFRK